MSVSIKNIPKHTVEIELPVVIFEQDYHSFSDLEETLQQFIPDVCITELGFCEDRCDYIGIIHKAGSLSDEQLSSLAEELEAKNAKLEEANEQD